MTTSQKTRRRSQNFLPATRNALQFGSKNKGRVAEILQKAANMNAADARAYANQWDGAYIASFEPADINSLKKNVRDCQSDRRRKQRSAGERLRYRTVYASKDVKVTTPSCGLVSILLV
jgi:hypothetical protein